MKFIAGVCAAMAIATVGLLGQAQPEITVIGCLRAWQPASQDPTKTPERVNGMFVLTPLQSTPTTAAIVPTYLLTPSQVVNFQQHLDDKVQVVGTPLTAPAPLTVVSPTERPENRPTVESMPRFTLRSLTKLSDSCPS
jgi:hypothetical protein